MHGKALWRPSKSRTPETFPAACLSKHGLDWNTLLAEGQIPPFKQLGLIGYDGLLPPTDSFAKQSGANKA